MEFVDAERRAWLRAARAAGIGVVATEAENVYTVQVFDAAGNSSGCSAPIPFTDLQNATFSSPKLVAPAASFTTKF
jgi:hypothetical protein